MSRPPTFASRCDAVAPFLAMEFAKRAALLEAEGHRVIRLNLGEPDFGAPQPVREALARAALQPSPYTPALGLTALREAIAARYAQTHGLSLDPARVVVTAGASAALLLACALLVEPGDGWLLGEPSYPCNRHFLASFGAAVQTVPTRAASRFQLDLAAVQRHATAATRGLLIASPSNPTGTAVPTATLQALLLHAREQGWWRVVDEIYAELRYPVDAPLPPCSLQLDDGALVVNSFSKTWGLTGWRLGWLVLPPQGVPVVERLAQNWFICASGPAQQAALSCFTPQVEAEVQSRRQALAERRSLVLEGLRRIGLDVAAEPDGAFYVCFDVERFGLGAMAFCEQLLAQEQVALTPGLDFGSDWGRHQVRLSYTAASADLQAALARLARFVSRLG